VRERERGLGVAHLRHGVRAVRERERGLGVAHLRLEAPYKRIHGTRVLKVRLHVHFWEGLVTRDRRVVNTPRQVNADNLVPRRSKMTGANGADFTLAACKKNAHEKEIGAEWCRWQSAPTGAGG